MRPKRKPRWNAGNDRDRAMPTAPVTDLPVMSGLRHPGMSVHPLEADGDAINIDPRMTAHVDHFMLTTMDV